MKEEELRNGGEPKYAHLTMELHVFVEVYAPLPEAYLRMAHAMEEVKKFLFPVSCAQHVFCFVFLERHSYIVIVCHSFPFRQDWLVKLTLCRLSYLYKLFMG